MHIYDSLEYIEVSKDTLDNEYNKFLSSIGFNIHSTKSNIKKFLSRRKCHIVKHENNNIIYYTLVNKNNSIRYYGEPILKYKRTSTEGLIDFFDKFTNQMIGMSAGDLPIFNYNKMRYKKIPPKEKSSYPKIIKNTYHYKKMIKHDKYRYKSAVYEPFIQDLFYIYHFIRDESDPPYLLYLQPNILIPKYNEDKIIYVDSKFEFRCNGHPFISIKGSSKVSYFSFPKPETQFINNYYLTLDNRLNYLDINDTHIGHKKVKLIKSFNKKTR